MFPLSEIPLQDIVRHVESGDWVVTPSCVFKFGGIHAAHRLLDPAEANGKIVVRL